jgi:hypothetical protein
MIGKQRFKYKTGFQRGMRNEERFLSEDCRGSMMAGFWTNREQRAESREQRAESREQRAGEDRLPGGIPVVRIKVIANC